MTNTVTDAAPEMPSGQPPANVYDVTLEEVPPVAALWYDVASARRMDRSLEHVTVTFAACRTAENLCAFTARYGPLGWDAMLSVDRAAPRWVRRGGYARLLASRSTPGVLCDPVDWALAHARTVEWCLKCRWSLQQRAALPSTPAALGLRLCLAGSEAPTIWKADTAEYELLPDGSGPGRHLAHVLTLNLTGVEQVATWGDKQKLQMRWRFRSLLEVIYQDVARVLHQQSPVVRCAAPFCGRVFEQTHGRQKFCPHPTDPHKASACGQRYRKQRSRGVAQIV